MNQTQTQWARNRRHKALAQALEEYRAGLQEDLGTKYDHSPNWQDGDEEFLADEIRRADEYLHHIIGTE